MHQVIEFDPQAIQAGLYIDVKRIYALGKDIDSDAFERAAWEGLRASEAEGEPLTLWPGKLAAIEEIGGSVEHRRWLSTLSFETLAGELIADRLMDADAVIDCCGEEIDEDEEPDLTFAVRCKLRLNQRAAA